MTNFLFLLYIQGKRSMAAILNFINAMIFFFSLFLVVTNVDASRSCKNETDCPDYLCSSPKVGKCYFDNCYCI